MAFVVLSWPLFQSQLCLSSSQKQDKKLDFLKWWLRKDSYHHQVCVSTLISYGIFL